jgi:hypothetical protein
VPGAGHEGVDLLVGGPAARVRLVHGNDSEELARRAAEGHEERVVGLPGVGVGAGLDVGYVGAAGDLLPVEALGGHEVGAPPLEARCQERHPGLAEGGLAEQRLDRLVVPHRGRGEHVVEGRAVDVHHHRVVAERLTDRARHLPENVLKILVAAHRGRALEHRSEPADDRERSRVHHWVGSPPMTACGGTSLGTFGIDEATGERDHLDMPSFYRPSGAAPVAAEWGRSRLARLASAEAF